MDGNFSVSWQTHQKNICNGFSNLQQRGEFVDMTLAAEGHHVQVHKMVMSIVSPYIKDLITTTQCAHPVIFLNNVSHETLRLILEYAYTGETLVPQDKFEEFMQASRSLNINGLDILTSSEHIELIDSNTIKTDKFNHQEAPEEFDDNYEYYAAESSHNESDSEIIFQNDNCTVETISKSHNNMDEPNLQVTESKEEKNPIRYTVSNQGNLQIILNRFMYFYRYQRKSNDIVWRCIDYYSSIKCNAMLITENGKIIKRVRPHNHPFHDHRILKCTKNNKIYAMLSEAQNKADFVNKDK